jgi:hypothetical protein
MLRTSSLTAGGLPGNLRARDGRARPRTEARRGRRHPAGAQRHASPASGRDRIVGVMCATRPHDAVPSNCGRGATMGPPGCSLQSSPVVFRSCCCTRLQGLSASWDDSRGQKVFLIRKRSQVRVLDRPLAFQFADFPAFDDILGFGALTDRMVEAFHGAIWGHHVLPVWRKSALRFARLARRRRTQGTPSPRTEGTGRRLRDVRLGACWPGRAASSTSCPRAAASAR